MKLKAFLFIILISAVVSLSACDNPQASELPPADSSATDISLPNSTNSSPDNSVDTSESVSSNSSFEEAQSPINPFTGENITAEELSSIYPTAVMVNNIKPSLPQSGIGDADIIYEIVTEGGITRLMAVFSDGYSIGKTGPVRSARDQHVQLMLPYVPLFVHIGSSIYADEMLETYGYTDTRDINGMYTSSAIFYDEERAALLRETITDVDEHCWYTSGDLLADTISRQNFTPYTPEFYGPMFNFLPEGEERILAETANRIDITFSDYGNSSLIYNEEEGIYEKTMYGEPQIDENTGEQLGFKNVIVLFTDISTYPDGELANVNYAFGGVGQYFTNGGYEDIRWIKGAANEPLRIVDPNGFEIPVEINAGKTYIAIVALDYHPQYKIS